MSCKSEYPNSGDKKTTRTRSTDLGANSSGGGGSDGTLPHSVNVDDFLGLLYISHNRRVSRRRKKEVASHIKESRERKRERETLHISQKGVDSSQLRCLLLLPCPCIEEDIKTARCAIGQKLFSRKGSLAWLSNKPIATLFRMLQTRSLSFYIDDV